MQKKKTERTKIFIKFFVGKERNIFPIPLQELTKISFYLVYNGNTKIFLEGLLMTKHEIQSYENMGIPVSKKARKKYYITAVELLEYGLLFLMSRIFLVGSLSPFGLSFFAAVFRQKKRPHAVLSCAAGILAAGMGLLSMKYLGALVICCTFFILMDEELSKRAWLYGVISGLSVLVTGSVFLAFDGFLLYDALRLLLEGILIFLSYPVFGYATDVLHHLKERSVFEPTESLSLLALCAGVCLSFATTVYFQSIGHIISIFAIFVAALTGGFSLSCCAGILFGVVNSLADVLPAQVVAVYSVNAICAGLLQKKGRWGVLLAFFASNCLAALYFSGSVNRVIAFYHILASGVLLFLMPDQTLALFGEVMKTPAYQTDTVTRLREMVQEKLSELSRCFSELSAVFTRVVENRVDTEIRDPGYLFDRTADQVCRNCSLMNFCWQKEYAETRHSLLTLYHRMEHRGRAEREDVPESFQRECIRLDDFLENLNQNYELHKINLLWAGRVSESRSLVAEQFHNLSSVLSHLKVELDSEISAGVRLERKIAAALDREGLSPSCIRVVNGDGLEVTMNLPAEEHNSENMGIITSAVSRVAGVPVMKIPCPGELSGGKIRFQEKPRFAMETGFAKVAGSLGERSGDYHMFSHTGDGKYILALSDGMGQGGEAEAQSSMTVHLIRKLLSAGFDKETALKLINSMLMVSSKRESFATADLCLANLYSGALEFIKIGAANSYLKTGQVVEKISSTSLPAGILREIEADCDLKYAIDGDFVVMVTDGITDVLDRSAESGLMKIIRDFEGNSPQSLADQILYRALRESGGKPKDDMTVLVAKMTEN